MFHFFGDLGPIFWVKLKILLKNSLEDLLIVIALKWRVAAQHNEKDYAKTPNVAREIVIASEDFWCHVIGSANYGMHFLIRVIFLNLTEPL